MALRASLRNRHLPCSGKKTVLIERLIESIKKEHGIAKECSVSLSRIDDCSKKDTGERDRKMVLRSMIHQKANDTNVCKPTSSKVEEKNAQHYKLKRTQPRSQNLTKSVILKKMSHKMGLNDNGMTNLAKKTVVEEKRVTRSMTGEPPEKKSRIINPANNGLATKSKKVQRQKPIPMKKIPSTALCLKPALRKFEMVWAHVKGYRNWPGIIEGETPNGQFTIHFFGDFSRSNVSKHKIMHLLEGFKDYANIEKPTALLVRAITEAQMFILDQNRKTCPICELQKLKQSDEN